MEFLDIRKVAQCVNEKLKNLIRPSDDDDTSTDISDQIQMNLISGSPMKSTPSVKLEFQPEPIAISDKVEDTSRPRAEANANVNQHSDSHQLSLLNVLGILVAHMKFTEQETRLETLRWLLWLHKMLPKRVSNWMLIKLIILLIDLFTSWEIISSFERNVNRHFRQGK